MCKEANKDPYANVSKSITTTLLLPMTFKSTINVSTLVEWYWIGSLLDRFVSSFDRPNGLSMFQFDGVRFNDFSAKDFDRWV